jgi:Flp pilus assembly pilin Flp
MTLNCLIFFPIQTPLRHLFDSMPGAAALVTELDTSATLEKTMKLLNIFKHFAKDEDGAVTVDWVVLTAAIVGLGLLVMNTIRPGITGAADQINTSLTNAAAGNFTP